MIYYFRKEIGKWKLILWPVLISLAASSFIVVQRSSHMATAAIVNGRPIEVREYTKRFNMMRDQIAQLRAYAKSSGLPVETFMQLYGMQNPAKAALDACIYEKLVDDVLAPLSIYLHEDVLSAALLQALPKDVIDDAGTLNQHAYKTYLSYQRQHIAEFEDSKEEELRQMLFEQSVKNGAYRPSYARSAEKALNGMLKSFDVVTISFDEAKRAIKRQTLSDGEIAAYYEANREKYRVAEQRSISYWLLQPTAFEEQVDVSDEAIERFYEKNKATLYRIQPQIKVRHIHLDDADDAFMRANDAYKRVLDDPASFAAVAREVSENKDSAYHGGERDFFSRGTYDKDFEKAAFRLKEVGSIAPLTKVDGGYEIIQLIDRIPAKERTLEEVRKDVIAAVRGKRALEWLRSSLEQVRRDAPDKNAAIQSLTKRAARKEYIKNAVLGKGDMHSLEGKVVSHAYQIRAKEDYAFFMHENNYVLVLLDDKKASFIPPLKDVLSKVTEDIIAQKAHDEVALRATKAHAEMVSGQVAATVAQTCQATADHTDFMHIRDKNSVFGKHAGLQGRAFELTSPLQVLRQASGNDVCLVRLREMKRVDEASEPETLAEIRSALDADSSYLGRAFIASLRRSATIELNEKMLATQVAE